MIKDNELYLDTGLSQIETNKILVEELESSLEYITYNVKRYDVPASMILFYSSKDISSELHNYMRLTDVIKSIKIGDAYFNFVFLLFTDNEGSYNFLKHIEVDKLCDVDNYVCYKELEPAIHNVFNFLNSYLFQIAKKETFL